ncbi:MAG: hypothetical protein Q6366_017760 [Candidatus Freyarchaeota archaeon]
MSERYLSAPSSKDMAAFEAMVQNVREDLQDAARSAADSVSSLLRAGDFKRAADYIFDMVAQSLLINLLEPPRKAIEFIKGKRDRFSELLENPIFKASEKLLESFEKGNKELFVGAMQAVEESVIGKTSIDFRYTIMKDLHCAFYKYVKS